MHEAFRHNYLLDDVINVWSPLFISKIWKHLFKLIRNSCKLFLGYHPKNDGQTGYINKTLDNIFAISSTTNKIIEFLNLAEFAYNNSIHFYETQDVILVGKCFNIEKSQKNPSLRIIYFDSKILKLSLQTICLILKTHSRRL